jgi:hypothetical protein
VWLFYVFFIFEEWCKCTFSKRKKAKKLRKNIFFVGVTDEKKEQDPEPEPDPLVRATDPWSGSGQKCHGSGTLVQGSLYVQEYR